MRLRRRRRSPAGESSAASDVAFLLIIYFIVIAGFNINLGFLLELPAQDAAPRVVPREDILRFDMDAAGGLSLRGEPLLNLDAAAREIEDALAANSDVAVVLTIDPAAPWQKVVLFVELAQTLHVGAFSFSTASPAAASPQQEGA